MLSVTSDETGTSDRGKSMSRMIEARVWIACIALLIVVTMSWKRQMSATPDQDEPGGTRALIEHHGDEDEVDAERRRTGRGTTSPRGTRLFRSAPSGRRSRERSAPSIARLSLACGAKTVYHLGPPSPSRLNRRRS